MINSICIDTNTYVAFLEGDKQVVDYIKNADEIILPFIVVGELYYGFYRGTKAAQNISNLNRFLRSNRVKTIHSSDYTAATFGEIATELANIGKPMQQNDIWIAAICKNYDSSLLTYDKGFRNIIGLNLTPLQ